MVRFPPNKALFPAIFTVPLSLIYGWGARLYHARFDLAPGMQFRSPVPVISVGNLGVGGTGKTPTVIALAKLLSNCAPELAEPQAIAVLSRGYGRLSKKLVEVQEDSRWEDAGDEPLLIKRALPEAGVVVHSDRRLAAAYAVNRLNSKLLLLDDGFQHRVMGRDCDMVLLDGERPVGNGWMLPAGPLREPVSALERASIIVGIGKDVSGAEAVARDFGKPFLAAERRSNLPEGIDKSFSVILLASIANTDYFEAYVAQSGVTVCGKVFFRDHHRYSEKDLERVYLQAKQSFAKVILTTEKDLMRIREWRFEIPLLPIGYEMAFRDEQAALMLLSPIIERAQG
jgi:tetraacyldisaccharide 4'-kinase